MTRQDEGGNGVDARRAGASARTPAPARRPKSRKAPLPRSRWTPAEIEMAFARWRSAEPAPRSDLEYSNAFTLLVAVVLSAQATDAGVNKATRGLFAAADNPAAMVALGEDAVREHIRTIGLFRNKAKNVILLSEALVAKYGGAVPADRAGLQALAGVGRKTANVVLNIAFGHPEIAVDTHIFRVANRTGMAPGKDPDQVEANLQKRVPGAYKDHAHHWLILHGRYMCKARSPDCGACRIADLCKWPEKTSDVAAV